VYGLPQLLESEQLLMVCSS